MFLFLRQAGKKVASSEMPSEKCDRDFVMAVKIRLKRVGARNRPVYRVVVADGRSPRDGKFIEEIGTYHPLREANKVSLDMARVDYWIGNGAQPSDTVKSFIRSIKREAAAAKVSAES
ncbi:MAG: 30S ribosomal protein S16 [Verrucomicrobia subdivision 3 bacterium]|nr:30S ribosomal protein S16 [Limisphaerales bacterium]MCS1417299.1 30S ribosomal protein S16 [Limisphaerales bacterium]